jgi:hypothetical protein
VRVEIGYFTTGGGLGAGALSGGTRASAAGVLLEPGFAFRGGRVVSERAGARGRSFTVGGKARKAMSVGSSEHFALPRSFPALRDVDVLLGWFGGASDAMRALSLGTSLVGKLPGAREVMGAAVGRLVKGSSGGPDAQARASTGSLVVAEAIDAGGLVLATVVLEGGNPYDFTAGILAWAAHAMAAGRTAGRGAIGPVEAFGIDALEEGARSAGIARRT